MPSWLKTILIKDTVKTEKVRPHGVWLKKFLPAQLKMSIYSKEFLTIYMEFLEFAHILWKQQSQRLSSQTTNPLHAFSKRRQFRQHCGIDVIMCCNFTSNSQTLPIQSTLRLIFSLDWISKSRRRYVSKTGKISKQYQLKWPHLPQMSVMKNIFLFTQADNEDDLKEQTPNGKNNPDKTRRNG